MEAWALDWAEISANASEDLMEQASVSGDERENMEEDMIPDEMENEVDEQEAVSPNTKGKTQTGAPTNLPLSFRQTPSKARWSRQKWRTKEVATSFKPTPAPPRVRKQRYRWRKAQKEKETAHFHTIAQPMFWGAFKSSTKYEAFTRGMTHELKPILEKDALVTLEGILRREVGDGFAAYLQQKGRLILV